MTRMPKIAAACVALVGALSLLAPAARATPKILDLPEVLQDHDQWCWVGVTRSALLSFGVDQSQCAIAEYTRTHTTAADVDLGAVDCCVDWNQGCNHWNYFWYYGGSIADILQHFGGLQNVTYERPLSLEDVSAAIDGQRLAFIRWDWSSGGGHFLVAHGYDGADLYVMNPWPGEGLKIVDYQWLRSGDIHTWATSLTTGRATSCAGKTDGASCDDGNACTRADQCRVGACLGTPVLCPATACLEVGSCDPATGQCAAAAKADGLACSDDDLCTESERCLAGECLGTPKDCSAATDTPCQGSKCNPKTGQCAAFELEDGAACPDGTCQDGSCSSEGSMSCNVAAGPASAPVAAWALVVGLLGLRRRRS
ncbi:MAG: hypothetical protein HY901_37360 [Deltaproteobacteria bacterium]|nr:hypothetical protein [Deltaproteobacteria bacterium]